MLLYWDWQCTSKSVRLQPLTYVKKCLSESLFQMKNHKQIGFQFSEFPVNSSRKHLTWGEKPDLNFPCSLYILVKSFSIFSPFFILRNAFLRIGNYFLSLNLILMPDQRQTAASPLTPLLSSPHSICADQVFQSVCGIHFPTGELGLYIWQSGPS